MHCSAYFLFIHFTPVPSGERQPEQLGAYLAGDWSGRLLERRLRCWHEEQPVQLQLLESRLRHKQMPEVNWIKRPAKNADALHRRILTSIQFQAIVIYAADTSRLRLAFARGISNRSCMALPEQPVTLSPEQVADLNKKLATMRHDINNNLSMIMAAAELARLKPDVADKMLGRLLEQPTKITAQMKSFSAEFEKTLQITVP